MFESEGGGDSLERSGGGVQQLLKNHISREGFRLLRS